MYKLVLSAILVSSFGLAGCGSKAADCNNFTKVANANVETLKKADPKDAKSFETTLKTAADSANAIQIKDEGLAPLVKEYVGVYEKSAAAAKNIGSDDPAVQKKALDDIGQMEKEESTVVDKINAYCK